MEQLRTVANPEKGKQFGKYQVECGDDFSTPILLAVSQKQGIRDWIYRWLPHCLPPFRYWHPRRNPESLSESWAESAKQNLVRKQALFSLITIADEIAQLHTYRQRATDCYYLILMAAPFSSFPYTKPRGNYESNCEDLTN